jgi:hypothetical protein
MGTSQDRGRDFEGRWAKRIGGQVSKGSGNYYLWRLDVRSRSRYLWSLKHTDKESFRLTYSDIREVETAAISEGVQPVMAISIGGREYVLQPADDWIQEHTQEADVKFIKPDKSEERIAKRKTSPLFRD